MATEIPDNPQRIILINPTRYLGNFLIAGGLIQSFSDWCTQQGKSFCVVLDESLAPLCRGELSPIQVIWYPRQGIQKASLFEKLRLYRGILGQIRQFNADLAFNIEEETAISRLTQLSGAGFRLGCSTRKHSWGYDGVLPIRFENREKGYEHRWHSFADTFSALGMGDVSPGYFRFASAPMDTSLQDRLARAGLNFTRPVIAVHAGATKDYKKYPAENFAALCKKIQQNRWQAVLIGAGSDDIQTNADILARTGSDQSGVFDLVNQLDLPALKAFLGNCHYMVGNDSGPSHLASALGVPGTVIFGPTDAEIWRPLGKQTRLQQNASACEPACSKAHCALNRRCLQQISPDDIFRQITQAVPS